MEIKKIKKILLWLLLFITTMFWINTYAINVDSKIMNLLSNKIHNKTLVKYLWQKQIDNLEKYCSKITTWQVINLVIKW